MSTQPEALRLAELLKERYGNAVPASQAAAELRRLHEWGTKLTASLAETIPALEGAANELDRLHEMNAELVEALQQIIELPEDSRIHYKVARKALAKATGEQHG